MPDLLVRRGTQRATTIHLGRSALLGRTRRADVWLPDRGVSARHALVRTTDAGTFVMDLGSQNGTFVNQRRVDTPVKLVDGDVLRLGDAIVEFRVGEPPPPPSDTVMVRLADVRPDQTHVMLALPTGIQKAPPRLERRREDVAAKAAARYAVLQDELGRLLMKSLSPAALLPQVADRLLAALPQAQRVFVLRGDGREGQMQVEVARVRSGDQDLTVSRTLISRVIEKREAVLYSDVHAEGSIRDADSMQMSAVRAVMCAPMAFDDQLFGVIQVDTTASIAAFTDSDMHMLVAVATQVAATLAYAGLHERRLKQELLDHDLALARRIQRQFLPEQPPEIDGFGFAVHFQPAMAVGGDFFDFLPLDRGRLAMVVGDVSGKGVAAAIYGASVLAELRALLQQYADPVRVLQDLNVRLSQRDREGMFVTLSLATVAIDSGELSLATAGHPLPYVRSGDKAVAVLGETGPPPLGIDDEARFTAHRYALDDGDTVLAYTDGIPEAVDEHGELFGQERLSTAMGDCDGSAAGACETVLDATLKFLDGQPFGDDVTITALAKRV